ncbi:MAG TPA: hypothetical protein VKU01_36960 [Bryobacteraceae bacterium]|nr:hypothetical protein [Bryobacteraceae bacterium]
MKIRQAQVNAFQQSVEQRFVDRSVAFLRNHFGAVLDTHSDPQLQALVHRGIDTAKINGVNKSENVLRIIVYLFQFGGYLGGTPAPWLQPVLARRIDEDTKVHLLSCCAQSHQG